MPDNKNNDVINDILNELDSRSTQPEEPAEQETITETNFIDDPAIEETQQVPDPVSSTQSVSHAEIEEEPSIETSQRNVRPASTIPPKGKKRKSGRHPDEHLFRRASDFVAQRAERVPLCWAGSSGCVRFSER